MPLAVVSAPAGFFQVGQVNNATIEDLTSEINDALGAVTAAGTVVADAQTHADAAQASATAASSSAATAAAAASSVTNPLSTTLTSDQTVASAVSLGTNSTNFVKASGASGSATVAATGGGTNAQLILRGLGSGINSQVNIGGTAGGGAFNVIGATANGGALRFTQSSSATTEHTFDLLTNTAGVVWSNVPTKLARGWSWSGLQTGAANRSFAVISTVTGGVIGDPPTADAAPIVNLQHNLNGFNLSGIGARGLQSWVQVGANTNGGVVSGLVAQISQSGAPGLPGAWAASTSYPTAGALVINGGILYRVETPGVSGSGGGPTGGGNSITDGSVVWSNPNGLNGTFSTSLIGSTGQVTAAFNAGGSAGATVGHQWGGLFISNAASGATYYNESIGVEVDDFWHGANINKIVAVQVVKNGVQGDRLDCGLSLGARQAAPSIGWKRALLFQTAVSATGYGISFEDFSVGLRQHMAGAFDARMVVPDGAGSFGGGFFFRWSNGQLDQAGAAQFRCGSVTPTAAGIAVDVTNSELQSLSVTAGGANWNVGSQWKGDDGSYGVVATVSGSAVATVTITIPSQVATVSPPTTVTLSPMGPSGTTTTGTGDSVWPTPATATPTYAAPTNPQVALGSAAVDVVVGKGSVGSTTDTAGHLHIPFVAGAPTGVPANASKGIALRYDTTNHKLWAYDNGTSTWKGIVLT